jgi:ABC-type sugar transport system substrate-binding protein
LLEAFEPAIDGAAPASAARLEEATAELTREGTPVVYRRTISVSEDETSFHVLEAAGKAAVEAAARRAGLQLIRVVPAVERVGRNGA